ncbi:hypothetical protein ACOZ4L_16845 (plasmid) [Haloplanus ruber]|uniref:Uncharacterized protein n=1 Tax=Haloplanus ruber TaxID=869892 RepID=A0ABD6D297_9EURY|nr:hypothetical protein [Haloplanus ruber]
MATELIATAKESDPAVLDRMDRLRVLEDLLVSPSGDASRLSRVFGTSLTTQLDQIEAAREEVLLLTGNQPTRHSALETVCDELDGVASRDALDLLTGISSLEKQLRNSVEEYTSSAAVLEAGAEVVTGSEGSVWQNKYSGIERINVVGISTLGTPLLTFLTAIGRETSSTVHLYLRAHTGPRIASRLRSRLNSGGTPSTSDSVARSQISEFRTTPVTEIVAKTRAEEARAAVATCDGLLQKGVSVSDIAIVARDIDKYERVLTTASDIYGRRLSFWTQLELKRTLPYRVVAETCSLLAAASDDTSIDTETMFQPLKCQWIVTEDDAKRDEVIRPFTPAEISELRQEVGTDYSGTLAQWRDTVGMTTSIGSNTQRRFENYLDWCQRHRCAPEPDDILATLGPVLNGFETVVLPDIEENDTAAYAETSRAARAMQRVAGDTDSEHLLREARAKYADWRDRHQIESSWSSVLEVIETIATVRPGRREHENAERLDVLDATDTWLRSYAYVIALGFVDGEWPQQPHGELPVKVQTAVTDGDSPEARSLGVRGAWTEEREYDHAVDALRTATNHMIVTRFTEDMEGVTYQRSPLLEELSTTTLGAEAYHELLDYDAALPDRLRNSIPEDVSTEGVNK